MPIPILKMPIEVGNRVDELGTSLELLLTVVDAVVAARNECTDNDPSGARGWRGWQMGTRRNREVHAGEEWARDDTDQIASIVNKKRDIRVVVCNTDDGTCIEAGKGPKNRSKKGAATDRAVDLSQLSFEFPEPPGVRQQVVALQQVRESKGIMRTYYLCVYHEGDDIRAELSCAVQTSNGFFGDFKERIFIIGGEAGTADPIKRRKPDEDGGDSEFEIPVTRKK